MRLRRDEPAIIFEGRTITHGEFAARAFQLARALQRLGLRVGDRLAILAQNCPEYMEVYAAGELGGWTTVTINYRLAEPEVAYILSDSRPKIVVCEASLLDRLGERRAQVAGARRHLRRRGTGYRLRDGVGGRRSPQPPIAGSLARYNRLPDLHQRHDRAAERRDALAPRTTLVRLCVGDRHGRAADRPRRGRHAALSHRRQEHLPYPVGARLHRRSASRVPRSNRSSKACRTTASPRRCWRRRC